MEIYKSLDNKASKEFEKLLNNQLSQSKVEEGKIIEGTVTKITEKFVFLYINGLKSEPLLYISELKALKIENIEIGSKIPVLLETLENKNGEVIVSASKAKKIEGWNKIVKLFENKEIISGKIISKTKGGVIVEHTETESLLFCPASQLDTKPLKDISHLMNTPLNFLIVKCDYVRGNCVVSRRDVLLSKNKEDKVKIIERYTVGDVIKGAICKGYTNYGVFFDLGDLDCLVHIQELSYSRINHPDELFNIGDKHDLKVISIDKEKLQIGASIKALSPNPFNNIGNYEVDKIYKVKIVKIQDYGCFCELQPGLGCLLHSSELSWTKKNPSAKKMFKVGQEINCKITSIDIEKQRIALSYKKTQENPFQKLSREFPVGSEIEGTIANKNEYALFVKLNNFEIEAFLHINDISWNVNNEEELSQYKKNDKIKVKIVEINEEQQKIRVSKKALENDPFMFFKNKKIDDTITVEVIKSDNKGLLVKPEGCSLEFTIKKSEIAIASADARTSRFVAKDRIDSSIKELNFDKRKVVLSIKRWEEIQNSLAVSKFGSSDSGKNLPFSKLSEKLDDKKNKKK